MLFNILRPIRSNIFSKQKFSKFQTTQYYSLTNVENLKETFTLDELIIWSHTDSFPTINSI